MSRGALSSAEFEAFCQRAGIDAEEIRQRVEEPEIDMRDALIALLEDLVTSARACNDPDSRPFETMARLCAIADAFISLQLYDELMRVKQHTLPPDIGWNGGEPRWHARGQFIMFGPQIVKVCVFKLAARFGAWRRRGFK